MKHAEDFDRWNEKKKKTHFDGKVTHFCEGEIWWTQFGQNIGSEILGKGENFLRPALILRRFYKDSALVVPLSLKIKDGNYFFPFYDKKNVQRSALFTQIRCIDGKRLMYCNSKVSKSTLSKIKKAYINLIKNHPTPHKAE